MSWIDDATKQARDEDEERTRREQTFNQQAPGLWADLRYQVEQDITAINQNQELRARRLGGDELRLTTSDSSLVVSKMTFPAIHLRVQYHLRSISLEREVIANGQVIHPPVTRESISIEQAPDYRLFLKSKQGKALTIVEASKYLLAPFFSA